MTPQEKIEALEAGVSEAGSELAAWRGLMEHPGWKMYEQKLMEERTMRAFAVTANPINSVGGAFSQEFMKGEASGLSLAANLPATEVEQRQLEINTLMVKIEGEKDAIKREIFADERSRVPDDNREPGSASDNES